MRASNEKTGLGRQAAVWALWAVRLLVPGSLPAWCPATTATATQTRSTRFVFTGKRWVRLVVFALGAVLAFPGCGLGQVNPNNRLTNTADATLAAVLPFAALTPARSTTPVATSAAFRLRNKTAAGYRLDAQLTSFIVTPTALADGGTTIARTDIGVGIISIVPGSSVLLPRNDVITSGYNYNPGTRTSPNGLTPYQGQALGTATLNDLVASKKILGGNRIAADTRLTTAGNYLTVTMAFGLLPQYFTPASFSAVLTLTISNGP